MNAGNLFGDLIASVERAEKTVSKPGLRSEGQTLFSGDLSSTDLSSADLSSEDLSSEDLSSAEPFSEELHSTALGSADSSPAEQSRSVPPAHSKLANFEAIANPPQNLKPEQLPQSLGLSPADWNLALLFIVHAQLVRTLEPGHDFPNAVNIHQVGAVRPPKQSGVKTRE